MVMSRLIYFSLFALAISCGAASDSGSSGSSGSSGGTGFAPSDLGGAWVGRLTPDDPNNHEVLFYFNADTNGDVSGAADSRGNEWASINASIEAEFLSDGKLSMDYFSGAEVNKLHMEQLQRKMEKLHQLEELKELDKLHEMEEQLHDVERIMRDKEVELRQLEKKMMAFERELEKELVKDGYLKNEEKFQYFEENIKDQIIRLEIRKEERYKL